MTLDTLPLEYHTTLLERLGEFAELDISLKPDTELVNPTRLDYLIQSGGKNLGVYTVTFMSDKPVVSLIQYAGIVPGYNLFGNKPEPVTLSLLLAPVDPLPDSLLHMTSLPSYERIDLHSSIPFEPLH